MSADPASAFGAQGLSRPVARELGRLTIEFTAPLDELLVNGEPHARLQSLQSAARGLNCLQKTLQSALGVTSTGRIDDATLAAVQVQVSGFESQYIA